MTNPCVLVDLTEQILSIDHVQRPTEQPGEVQPEPLEMLILRFDHVSNDLDLDPRRHRSEAFSDTVSSARSGDDEVVLIELDNVGIV